MRRVAFLEPFEQIKLLADPRRMQLLRLLMAEPATLTHLAKTLDRSPAWVRHHILVLESADLIELAEVRTTGKVTEKFYRARASAFLLQEMILPDGEKPAIVFSGSHDLALEKISEQIADHLILLNLPVGSLDGLANLRQDLCQISGAHLLDTSGEYNTPFIRHFFPDRIMQVVTLAHRTQGLMLQPGNPLGIRGLPDLARVDLHFINRNPGSGTRLWLDRELQHQGIPAENIRGYDQAASTHTACAKAVHMEKADAALGLQASAKQFGLEFIPLLDERYDLILPEEHEGLLAPLLDFIQTAAFRKSTSLLSGYSTNQSGEQILI